jgi:hypothetical protein
MERPQVADGADSLQLWSVAANVEKYTLPRNITKGLERGRIFLEKENFGKQTSKCEISIGLSKRTMDVSMVTQKKLLWVFDSPDSTINHALE